MDEFDGSSVKFNYEKFMHECYLTEYKHRIYEQMKYSTVYQKIDANKTDVCPHMAGILNE